MARQTPCLFGLHALAAVFGGALHREHPIAIRAAAWYPKGQATFSDVLATVRRHGRGGRDIRTSRRGPAHAEISRARLDRLLNAVCYSH